MADRLNVQGEPAYLPHMQKLNELVELARKDDSTPLINELSNMTDMQLKSALLLAVRLAAIEVPGE